MQSPRTLVEKQITNNDFKAINDILLRWYREENFLFVYAIRQV